MVKWGNKDMMDRGKLLILRNGEKFEVNWYKC